MATIEKALRIAAEAHEGQTDKDDQPDIIHPLRVMASVEGEETKVVAVLHGVVEDSDTTEDDLRREGFGEPVLAAPACLTHREGESYAEYVVPCKGNEVARRVKLAAVPVKFIYWAMPGRPLLHAGWKIPFEIIGRRRHHRHPTLFVSRLRGERRWQVSVLPSRRSRRTNSTRRPVIAGPR
jgi:hypothetical protein